MKALKKLLFCACLIPLLAAAPASIGDAAAGPRPDSCPQIRIHCSPEECRGPKYTFAVSIQGGHPDRDPTFKWSVSAGAITKGQGTGAIEVDAGDAGDKPLTVTVEVGNIIPKGCDKTQSRTTEGAKSPDAAGPD